jgi:hypothetical protein
VDSEDREKKLNKRKRAIRPAGFIRLLQAEVDSGAFCKKQQGYYNEKRIRAK